MQHNSFGALRLIASLVVIYTHSFPLALGVSAHEPIIGLEFSLGTVGVFMFFAISGILVTKSLVESRSLIHFCVFRAVRIFPALLVCLILCAFVLGSLVTQIPFGQYFSEWGLYSFLLRNMTLLWNVQSTLPGVFASNPLPNAVNDPLWTLTWEIRAYLLLAIGTVFFFAVVPSPQCNGSKRYRTAGILLFLLSAANAIFWSASKPSLFLVLFFLGGALYLLELGTAAMMTLLAGTTILAILGYGTPMFDVLFVGWLAVSVYILGFSGIGESNFLEKYDLSYGLYIYAFPVGQLLVFCFHVTNPWVLLGLNTAVAALLAATSWLLVEKPMLNRKHQIADRVSFHFSVARRFGSA